MGLKCELTVRLNNGDLAVFSAYGIVAALSPVQKPITINSKPVAIMQAKFFAEDGSFIHLPIDWPSGLKEDAA